MSRNNVALSLLLAGLAGVSGCVTQGATGDGGGSDLQPFTNGVSTLTGAAEPGLVDGARGVARFANPVNVAYGPDGKLYVADFDNGKIRVVTEDGTTSTLFSQMTFRRPFGMVFKGSTLFVETDNDMLGNHDETALMTGSIWAVDIAAKKATIVANAIGRPRGLAVLKDGRIAIGDYMHHVVEILDPGTGAVTRIAGTWNQKGFADGKGVDARFSTPYGLVQRPDGSLLVADYDNNKLRIVQLDGTTTTLTGGAAGFQDGAMADAKFFHPQGMAIAANGDIFVTDLGNYRVRKISGDSITTIAGDGTGGAIDDDNSLVSELYGLEGLSLKPDASMIYLADGSRGEAVPYNRIRQVKMH